MMTLEDKCGNCDRGRLLRTRGNNTATTEAANLTLGRVRDKNQEKQRDSFRITQ